MTCKQVQTVFLAHPFASYAPRQLAAARAHAGTCEPCGVAMRTAETFDFELAGLAMVAPREPRQARNNIMGRIAGLEQTKAAASLDATSHLRRAQSPKPAGFEWLAGSAIAGGAAAVFAAGLYGLWSGEFTLGPLSIPATRGSEVMTGIYRLSPVSIVSMCGLLVFMAGIAARFRAQDDAGSR